MTIDTATITDRISWVAYRADWRRRYKEASEAIRAVKREIAKHRAIYREFGNDCISHRYAADGMQWDLRRKREVASRLMDELNEAKEHKAAIMAAKAEASEATVAA